MPTLNPKEVERQDFETRCQYSRERGGSYAADSVSRLPSIQATEYFDRLLSIRLEMARTYARGARVLDVGCATGMHLARFQSEFQSGVGLDFSHPLLKHAVKTLTDANHSTRFVEANARKIPFRDGIFDFVYSFSSLFNMPNPEEVLLEISRVLAPGGRCLLEMGNSHSLNDFVARTQPGLARVFHLSVPRMKEILIRAGLKVERHRAFQILPYWGNHPRWMRPLLHPIWKRCLEKRVRGKMLDEWISDLPGIRNLAFRHLFACVKDSSSKSSRERSRSQ